MVKYPSSIVWNMLRQLSSSHDNGQSMVIYHSVRCLCLITTDRAWLYIPKVWNMLGQLSSSRDNVHSMVIYPYSINHAPSVVIISKQRLEHGNKSLIYKNAPSVVIVTWQRSEHSNISLMCETYSVSCHQLMTTVRAWQYPSCIKHAPSVVIVSWQR